ncbi:MAG: patatin family protein [Deltaproteobacteria bacterium]|nr:patatin family protein [Deltaproteobacteria bacterium]
MENAALILEGGGMRGVYTAGVLRYFMDRNLYLPYVIGASIGACNGANYVARQPERNRIVNIHYVRDGRFLSYRRLIFQGELFGMQFIFDTLPHDLVPFDFETFKQSEQRFILTVFDCISGESVYFDKDELDKADCLTLLQAGSSLPLIQKSVLYQGRVFMDGGIGEPVPLKKSIEDGNQRHVLILTRPKGYRKKASRIHWLIRRRYPLYEGLHRVFAARHKRYNETMDRIDRLESEGKVFVIRPKQLLPIGRVTRSTEKLYSVYDQGYAEARERYAALCCYLNDPTPYRV